MKFAWMLIASFMLVACAPGSKKTATEPPPPAPERPGPGPGPSGGGEFEWGRSPCQVRSDCHDPVLNQSLPRIVAFLTQSRGPLRPEEIAAFYCGRLLGRAWEAELGGDGFDDRITEFLAGMIDPSACKVRPDWQPALRHFFVNHQEYGK